MSAERDEERKRLDEHAARLSKKKLTYWWRGPDGVVHVQPAGVGLGSWRASQNGPA